VCGFEAVQEALRNPDLDGRPDSAPKRARTFYERLGVLFVDGDFWQEQRRFTLRHLRDLGFGRTSSENIIEDEIHQLFDEMRTTAASNPDGIVDFKGVFTPSVVNVLWAVLGGQRFHRNDEKFKNLLDINEMVFRSTKPGLAFLPIPEFLFRKFPILFKMVGTRGDLLVTVQDFIRETINEHDDDRIESSPRDFIDVYLNELEKQGEKPSTFSYKQLISIIVDLFLAGSDTTSNSIGYAVLRMIYHPDILRKVQEELDSVCGDSLPSMAHRANLPYTEAVLLESMRIHTIAPFTVAHCALRDTQLQGYTIPKGSMLHMNLYSVHMDETYWKDPHVFRPERHLNDQGNFVKSDHVMPFSGGRRQCLGEALARNTYFLITTAVLKSFDIERVPNEPLPTLDPLSGATAGYQGFKAVVRDRRLS